MPTPSQWTYEAYQPNCYSSDKNVWWLRVFKNGISTFCFIKSEAKRSAYRKDNLELGVCLAEGHDFMIEHGYWPED
jgi:hypothetical protein